MLTFDEVMERLAEDRRIDQSQVPARVQRRKVWLAQNGMPGCMPNSSNVCKTKADAVAVCWQIAYPDAPRGFKTALERTGAADCEGERYTVERMTLADFL